MAKKKGIIYTCKKYYFIYITTNNINNKKYIGQHSTDNINDGYLGSGKHLLEAIKKYGKENFSRKILIFAKDKDELNKLEWFYINRVNATINREYYNISEGGGGNYFWGLEKHEREKLRKIWSEQKKGELNPMYGLYGEDNPNFGRKHTEESRKKISENHADINGENNPMYGKHHTEETKNKISENRIKSGIAKGKNNPKAIKVICKNTGEIFDCIKDAAKKYNVNAKVIGRVCMGKGKSAGKDKDGNKLYWEYYLKEGE